MSERDILDRKQKKKRKSFLTKKTIYHIAHSKEEIIKNPKRRLIKRQQEFHLSFFYLNDNFSFIC